MSELQAERTAPAPVGFLGRQLRETHVQLLASQVLTGGVAMVANVLMARALSPTGRGEVALILQIVYLATQVLLLGTERSFLAGYHGVAPAAGVRAYARLLIVPAIVTLVAATGFAVLAPDRYHPGTGIVVLIAGYAIVEAIILGTRAIAVCAGRMRDFLVARVIDAALLFGLLIVLYVTGVTHPVPWLLAYLFASVVPTVWQITTWLRLAAAPDATPVSDGMQRLVRREGLTLFPAALSNMAMLRVDRLALPALASTSALGLYASVATMTELLAWPLRAYADAKLGQWRNAHHDGGLRARPLIVAAAVYALVVTPVVAGAMYLLIVPLFGERYADAKVLVVPLVAAAGLYAISRVCLGLLIAKGRASLVSAAEICGFVLSFVAYLVLIPGMGILGAAYGSLIGYGACLVFAVVAARLTRERVA